MTSESIGANIVLARLANGFKNNNKKYNYFKKVLTSESIGANIKSITEEDNMNKRFKEKNIIRLLHDINTKKLVFIDRKKNMEFKKNYKSIIYKLDINNYRYSDYDNSKKYEGEKVHVFSYKGLYIKVKITDKTCKVLSMHVAQYEF